MSATLRLLCAGAAQGLVRALQQRFASASGAVLEGRFGAVGAMRQALLDGEPCDLFIATDRMVAELAESGAVHGGPRRDLGRVRTGIAARGGEPLPRVDTAGSLSAVLRGASAIYFPDPERATAGIHFARVLSGLGLADELRARTRTFPNGATAMRELARAGPPGAIGCTQMSEILCTEGVQWAGALPNPYELATVYTAAVAGRSTQRALAERFIELLTGAASQSLRAAGGFEPTETHGA